MKLPGFDILDKIGEGGTAVVWKAYQVSLDRTVAIKILKPEFARSKREVNDFIREARAAAKFKHPYVIQVYDVAEQNGIYYFVMEYIGGASVAKIIDDEKTIPQKKALKIVQCVAMALESAWNKSRLIHRDIKPDNIMVDEDDTVKLADLGLARIGGIPGTATASHERLIEGTPNYMSPEQARCADKLDCGTDMYSLGATLYHMLTGITPFDGYEPAETLSMHINGHIPNPRDINPSVTPALAQLITKLMMKDPEDRYATWSNILSDIKKISANRIFIIKRRQDADSTISEPEDKADTSVVGDMDVAPVLLWFSAVAWILLFVWWSTYLLSELKLPPLPLRQLVTKPLPIKTAAAPTTPPPLASAPSPQPAPSISADKQSEKPPEQPPPQTDSSLSPAVAQPDDKAQMDMLGMNVVNWLLAEDFAMAQTILQEEKGKPHTEASLAKIEELKKFVRNVSEMPTVIENAFRLKLSEPMELVINKQKRTLVIHAISNGTAYALTVDTNGGAQDGDSITFPLSQVDPLDRNRCLGPANTPAKYVMKFILFMKGRDYKSAKPLVADCGPLAEYFAKELESKSQPRQ